MKTGRKTKGRDKGFADRLQKLVAERNLTQREGAALAGVALSVFNGWCNGAQPADLYAIQKFCAALSQPPNKPVSFEELLTGKKSEPAPLIQEPEDIAKLFLKEDELFDGYIHLRASKVMLKKKPE